ncbi:MAG: hypothetical protein ACD_75C01357G0003, partial [uncultured bacterium]
MKMLLVAEYRQGRLLDNYTELLAFAGQMGTESAMFAVADPAALPKYDGRLYLAEVSEAGEYNPEVHKQLLLDVVAKEQPEMIVFVHSSYGWDLAPRLAVSLKAAQISEVVAVENGLLVAPMCNGKLRRTLKSRGRMTVVTLQAGTFSLTDAAAGAPTIIPVGG